MLRSTRPSGLVVFPYLAFLNPCWMFATSLVLWLASLSQDRRLLDPLFWVDNPDLASGLAVYLLWTFGIVRRTRLRSVIVGSHSIYFHDLRRRLKYKDVHIDSVFGYPAETVELTNGSFPLSVFWRAHWFHSLGFLSLSLTDPLSTAIRRVRKIPDGRSINAP